MDPRERIIVALDVSSPGDAMSLVEKLHDHVGGFKIGLELMLACLFGMITSEEDKARILLAQTRRLFTMIEGMLFFDGKLDDIPNTIAGAAKALLPANLKMVNMHATAGPEAMRALATNKGNATALAVTILTSLSYDDLVTMGLLPPAQNKDEAVRKLVVQLAELAQECELDGVIASPQEVASIRDACGPDFQIVTPGIRPTWAVADDQKRISTPESAIRDGATALVIGRAITKPPSEIRGPAEAAKLIAEEIDQATQ